MQYRRIVDTRNGAILAERAAWYTSPWRRFHGLMLRRSLPQQEAIALVPCNSVHMAFMRFAIDVAYLDRGNRIVKLVHTLRPYRVSLGGRHAHMAIELPAGTLERAGAEVGDSLQFAEAVTGA